MKKETRCVHSGTIDDDRMGGINSPMYTSELDEQIVDPCRFIPALALIKPAVSLGGVETTICSPAVTSHAKMSAQERRRTGVTDSLLRLSMGIEQVKDLMEDMMSAFKKATR